MTERIDWRAKQPSRVASRKIGGVEELETLHNQGHHMIEHLEERGMKTEALDDILERRRN